MWRLDRKTEQVYSVHHQWSMVVGSCSTCNKRSAGQHTALISTQDMQACWT